MPDHIIDQIFCYLNIDDKKSFSLTCRKLNNIFGTSASLRQVCFDIANTENFPGVTRWYKNMKWRTSFNLRKTKRFPENLVQTASSLKSFTFEVYRDDFAPSLTFLDSVISVYRYLTHLKLIIVVKPSLKSEVFTYRYGHLNYIHSQFVKSCCEEKSTETSYVMKHLKHLEITSDMFEILCERYNMNFIDNKIETFKVDVISIIEMEGMPSSATFNAMKSIIASQHLKTLHLNGNGGIFFVDPLLTRSNQLKEFHLVETGEITLTQQDNILYFLNQHRQTIRKQFYKFYWPVLSHRMKQWLKAMRKFKVDKIRYRCEAKNE